MSAVGMAGDELLVATDDDPSSIPKKREPESSPQLPRGLHGWRRHATAACPRGARLILPAFRQRVHTFTFSIFPSTTVRTTCRFGFHVRRVLLFACDTLFPNATP